jgi:hypothetical protein
MPQKSQVLDYKYGCPQGFEPRYADPELGAPKGQILQVWVVNVQLRAAQIAAPLEE